MAPQSLTTELLSPVLTGDCLETSTGSSDLREQRRRLVAQWFSMTAKGPSLLVVLTGQIVRAHHICQKFPAVAEASREVIANSRNSQNFWFQRLCCLKLLIYYFLLCHVKHFMP